MDGTVLRFGELKGPRAMIEQVKGFSYPASSLLGANTSLHDVVNEDVQEEYSEQSMTEDARKGSWWRISLASPKVRNTISSWYITCISIEFTSPLIIIVVYGQQLSLLKICLLV